MNEHQRQYVKLLVNTLYDVQSARVRLNNRVKALKRAGDISAINMAEELKEELLDVTVNMETNIERRIARAVKHMPIMRWMKLVSGIGTRYSGSLIGILGDIGRYKTVSALWSNCGMDVITICVSCKKIALSGEAKAKFLNRQVERRWEINQLAKTPSTDEEGFKRDEYIESERKLCRCKNQQLQQAAPKRMYFKGLLLTHNPFLKMTCWKIAGQFVRQGKFYRTYYEQQKEYYTARDGDKLTLGHIESRARRAVVKLFLSHLWEMWRKSEGLEAGEIYLQYKLGDEFAKHHTLIKPPHHELYG